MVRHVRIEVEPAELAAAADVVGGATQVLATAELTLRVLGAAVTEWVEDARLAVAARELFESLRWACADGLVGCATLEEALVAAAGSYSVVENRVILR